jgi:hypothetical protein
MIDYTHESSILLVHMEWCLYFTSTPNTDKRVLLFVGGSDRTSAIFGRFPGKLGPIKAWDRS